MKNNIGSTITKELSYYLDILRNIKSERFSNMYMLSCKEYVTLNPHSNKLMYINENDYGIELSFDITIDKLTFTEYIDKETFSLKHRYHRKTYTNVSMYLDEEYHFQQSTVDNVHFSTKDLAELYKIYNELNS